MSKEPKDIKAIFSEALEKQTAEERAAYLDEACGNDADLRSKVEALLKAHSEAGDFLEVPALGPGVNTDESPSIEGPGTRIGRYELLELIGEGGMGLVYLAEQQEPVRRNVALKIVKLGMDTKQVIARFEAERQTLAVLDHPNIAHVFDAGTTKAGRPYFVMEYVEGVSITKYCDEQKLNIEERLELFKQVCEGVHHAHQKGIIHRDIKPSNILISNHGDKAVPKIIDFGIAKAITQPLTEDTFFTHEGQLLGTPEYMSPEQVDLATQDIDTRSDIYSLGVLLYVLLAGALPFDRESLEHAGFAELQRTIREDEPPLPSTRLTNLGKEAKAIAENRRTQIITLTRRLHRELEWIPMKAMRKDRTRRYRSASELADDIQNYLTGTPLIAGPESTVYRTRKFVRKHAGSVATAALLLVVIVLGLVVSIAMGQRAEQARQQEAAARVEAEQARDKEATLRAQVEQALARAEKAERIAQERAEAYRRAMYSNNLNLAKEAINENWIARAQKLLNSCEPELRGWEWQRLNHTADQSIMTIHGHSSCVNSVAVSPDGRRIASASDDYTVKVWDTTTGSEVMTLRHNNPVDSVTFSPDGRHIASGGKDRIVKVWDATTGSELMTLRHDDDVQAITFSPDGKRIASGGEDTIVKVWDATSGAEVMTLRGHTEEIRDITFSPDNKLIVSSSRDNTIKIWDAATGVEIKTLTGHDKGVFSVTFSPDGKRIVSGSSDKTIRVWDVTTWDEIMTLSGHADIVRTVTFSLDGKQIISGSHDRTIKIWDAITGVEIMTLRGHAAAVRSVKLNLNGTRVTSAGYDQTIKTWNPAIDRDVLRLHGAKSGINQVAFSPDGKRIAASTRDMVIKLWDAVSGAEIITLRGHHGAIKPIAFSSDGRQIVTGSYDKTVKVWNVATGAMEMTLTGHEDRVRSVTFSPNGRRIVSGGYDKTIKIWNAATGAIEMTLSGHEGNVNSVTFSPDGRRIVSAGYDGTVRVWDASSGTELLTLRGHEHRHVYEVSVSPDGKRIASCGADKTVRVWDAATGEEVMTLRGHESLVRSVAFSPDGTRIVSADYNRAVKIWDAGTGIELMNLHGDFSRIRSAVFSPDGKSICVANYDGDIILWESAEPAAGYEPRQIANSAMELVGELSKKNEFYYEVLSRLKDEKTTSEPIRKVALQIANARLWKDARKLNEQSWSVIFSTDLNDVEYREALEKLEKTVSLDPNNYRYLVQLGVAQYRVGAYEDALATLARAKKMRGDAGREPAGPVIDGFRAMALHQLGRDKQASAVMQQLRSVYGELRKWITRGNQTFALGRIFEVEKFFAGEERTLLSIWELIEENKLDEASDLIEKARESKNANYVSRMEGAIKLLEVLRKRKQ